MFIYTLKDQIFIAVVLLIVVASTMIFIIDYTAKLVKYVKKQAKRLLRWPKKEDTE